MEKVSGEWDDGEGRSGRGTMVKVSSEGDDGEGK